MNYENLDDQREKMHASKEIAEEHFRHPEIDSWRLTRLLINWITPLINLANLRPLNEDDIYPSPENFEVASNARKLSQAWALECERVEHPNTPSLIRVMYNVYKEEVWTGGFFQLMFTFMQLLQPIIIGQLIRLVSDEGSSFKAGLSWAIALGVVAFLSSSFLVYSFYTNRRLGLCVRAGVMMIIYEHAMQLTTASRMANDVGTTTNLMSIGKRCADDIERVRTSY